MEIFKMTLTTDQSTIGCMERKNYCKLKNVIKIE